MEIIEMQVRVLGRDGLYRLHPVLIKTNDELILVDCLYPGNYDALETAISDAGFDIRALTKIFITHADHDHIGTLSAILDVCPDIDIFASEKEAPYLTGAKKWYRQEAAETLLSIATGEKLAQIQELISYFKTVKIVPSVSMLKIGRCDFCPDLEIIATGGHTHGHISIYSHELKALIAGDALIVRRGLLDVAELQYAMDKPAVFETVACLSTYEIETVYCYHGGAIHGGISEQLEGIMKSYQK